MMPNFKPHEIAAAMRVLDHELETNFAAFIRKTFATVSPGDPFKPNWHIEAIAHALERVARGELKRLIILIPPRHLKSICASVAFPAWHLGHDPTQRIICVSYAANVAADFANDCRIVMQSGWYRRAFPATRIDPKKNTENEFKTTRRGSRFATSTGGVLTGRGGDIIIIDDPIKPQDALSEARRKDCLEWFSNTLLSRLDDRMTGAIVVAMQRLHIDDLAGHLLQQKDWEVLSLPAIAETVDDILVGPGLFHHREVGDLLHPERQPQEVLADIKAEIGSSYFSAQYQQTPVPAGGLVIHWGWFGFYTQLPQTRTGDMVMQSWDTASSTSELASYSVGITALITKSAIYLIDLVRGRWQFPDLQRQVIAAAQCHRPKAILIENHSSGMSLAQSLKAIGLSVIPIKPQGDKVMRMIPHTAKLEACHVFLPKGAPWLDEFRTELSAFPVGSHDDQVDALSQLMTWNEERYKHTCSIRPLW